jgi:hypothetical protein
MHGHKWEPAEGLIYSAESQPMQIPGQRGVRNVTVYDIEVRTPGSAPSRASIPSEDSRFLQPGMVVRLEINARTGEIRLHTDVGNQIISRGPAPVDPDAPIGSAQPGTRVLGTDFAQMFGGDLTADVQMVAGADAAGLLRTLTSGDPADRAAAAEQVRHIRDDAVAARPERPDRPSPADRVAALQQMVDRGQLSQADFETRRQRILDQI